MSEQDKIAPNGSAHSGSAARWSDDLRRQGPRHEVSADRAVAAARRAHPMFSIILIDDVGFGASSAFGGPCQTPNFEKLAADGLKYNRFHTTALCSPTRQALLTGRNHHSVGMGGITEIATSAPGYNSILPNTFRRSRERSSSTATRPRSSASATKCRSGRPARWARSMPGPPAAAGSSISMASSAARPTSGIRRSMKAPRRSSRRRRRRRAITSPTT